MGRYLSHSEPVMPTHTDKSIPLDVARRQPPRHGDVERRARDEQDDEGGRLADGSAAGRRGRGGRGGRGAGGPGRGGLGRHGMMISQPACLSSSSVFGERKHECGLIILVSAVRPRRQGWGFSRERWGNSDDGRGTLSDGRGNLSERQGFMGDGGPNLSQRRGSMGWHGWNLR